MFSRRASALELSTLQEGRSVWLVNNTRARAKNPHWVLRTRVTHLLALLATFKPQNTYSWAAEYRSVEADGSESDGSSHKNVAMLEQELAHPQKRSNARARARTPTKT